MIVRGGEVVGLCGYISPPIGGEVEIGFSIAASKRNRGCASAAVAAMQQAVIEDPLVDAVVARTAVGNPASQRVLLRSGFAQVGTESDDPDGEIIVWRHVVNK